VTLTFDPKINSGHLLVMTNHHTKFEVPRPKGSLVIDRKPFGLWTDKCKAMYPHFFEKEFEIITNMLSI
jgi:hypothetical protein